MKDRLNKTEFLRFLSCPNEFWLKANMPLLFTIEETLEYQHLRQQGYEVERYVKTLARFQDDETKAVDFKLVFQTADLYAESDAVITNRTTGTIDIYEIKSSASVKKEHLDDVAFQKIVAEQCGFTVGRCHVVTMNGEYIRQGEIDVEQLFLINDVTDQVAELIPLTEQQIEAAKLFVDGSPLFKKGRQQNTLEAEHIAEILDVYGNYESIEGRARVVSLDEIERHDWNLNIPRYVESVSDARQALSLPDMVDLVASLASNMMEFSSKIR